MRNVVVLPAPFGPEQAEDLAAAHLEADVIDRGEGAELADQVAHLDHDSRSAASSRTPADRPIADGSRLRLPVAAAAP